MGKIKKILENELLGGTTSNDVYPITSTQAVYTSENTKISDSYVKDVSCESSKEGMSLILKSESNTIINNTPIPAATTEKAGVMSAEDKKMLDSTKQIERLLTQTKDISSLEKREKGIFIAIENGVYSINTTSASWDSWVVDADNIKNIEATLGYATDLQCNVVFFKGNDFTVDNIITHIGGTIEEKGVKKHFIFSDIPSDCTKIVLSNRIASYSNPSIQVESYLNVEEEFQKVNNEIQLLKEGGIEKEEEGIELEIGANNSGKPTENNTRARTKNFVSSPFVVTTNNPYMVKAIYRYEQNGTYIDYATVNNQKYESPDDGYLYKIVFSNTTDSTVITTEELESIIESFKDKESIQEKLEKTTNITIPDVYITSQIITKFATYAKLIQAYDDLVASYPNIISKNELGAASDGQMLYEYVISNGSYNKEGQRGKDEEIEKPLVLLEAGMHGYEPESNTSLYIFVSDLVKGNLSLSKLRNTCDFKVIPCLNPYGYDAGKRGNKNNVDLNRNFEVGWKEEGDVSVDPSYYSGPSAASEIETQIMQQWLRDNVNAVLFIDFHNSSFVNEISCVGGANELEGMTEFKKKYLIGVHKLSSYFTSIFNIPDSSIWGYSYASSSLGGTSGNFRNSLGIIGGVLETPENVNNEGRTSPITMAVGADVLGTLILSCVKLE